MASREAKGPFPVEKPAVPGPSSGDVWRVPLAVWRARRALDRGELERARELVSPLLGRFGSITFIRKLAAEILYASADPLSGLEGTETRAILAHAVNSLSEREKIVITLYYFDSACEPTDSIHIWYRNIKEHSGVSKGMIITAVRDKYKEAVIVLRKPPRDFNTWLNCWE